MGVIPLASALLVVGGGERKRDARVERIRCAACVDNHSPSFSFLSLSLSLSSPLFLSLCFSDTLSSLTSLFLCCTRMMTVLSSPHL